METLAELITIVNRKRISKIDVLDKTFLNSKNKNLYFKLYTAIEKKQIKSDQEGGEFIYGTSKFDPRYRMLKSRLKEKVINTILFLDSEGVFLNNNQTKAYYNSLKHLHIIEILIKLNGTNKIVLELIKEDYKNAENYGFYDVLKSYSFHRLNYFSFKGDINSYKKEEINYLKFVDFSNKDQESKYLFWKILMCFTNKNNITNELAYSVEKQISEYKELVYFLQQPESIYLYHYLLLLLNETKGNVEVILDICNKLDNYLINHPEISNNMRCYLILYYRMKAYLHLKMFSKGLELLYSNSEIFPIETNNNWFAIKEFEFKLYLQDNKIEEATAVYQQVVKNKYLKRQVEQLSEKWKIFNAYLVFMDSYVNKGDFKFSLSKFLNEVPVNSKDKSGYNFAIRVIELMYMFARKEYNIVFQKMEPLRVYRTRYLNDNTYKRNHLFLSVLLKAEKVGFHGRHMQKADWPELQELRTQNNHIIADWEIIPYEVLWDIIVDLAKK